MEEHKHIINTFVSRYQASSENMQKASQCPRLYSETAAVRFDVICS